MPYGGWLLMILPLWSAAVNAADMAYTSKLPANSHERGSVRRSSKDIWVLA